MESPQSTDTGRAFHFEPLAERHLPLLTDWLSRPHVAEWWESPSSAAAVREAYFPQTARPGGATAYIASLNGEAIGFVQSYFASEGGDGWWVGETEPGAAGIDQFLCDPTQLGKGIGTRMVSAFARHVFADPRVTRIHVDPAPENTRAIRCYAKAGFREVGVVQTPDGPALLMMLLRVSPPTPP